MAEILAILFAVVFPAITVLALSYASLQRSAKNWIRSNTAMIHRGEPFAVVEKHWANPPWYVRLARRLP